MLKMDVLQYLIERGPGRTEVELARAIHGDKGYQQQVNKDLALLLGKATVTRRGEPWRYYPA